MSRLDDIEVRLAAATPGPWSIHMSDDACRRQVGSDSAGLLIAEPREWGGHMDASLIANAPADLAYLLGEVERQRDYINTALACTDPLDVKALLREAVAPQSTEPKRRDRHDLTILQKIKARDRGNA